MDFNKIVWESFLELQNKYQFKIAFASDMVTYSNKSISFSICYERKLEVELSFNVEGYSYRLIDFASRNSLDDSVIRTISKNHATEEVGLKRILDHLRNIMDRILAEMDVQVLLNDVREQKEELKISQVLEQLDRAWEKKSFQEYADLYQKNVKLLSHLKQSQKMEKRFLYAKKLIEIGD